MTAGGADLFVVCKKCGSEVSPYVTECPYCGTRLRKRAPKIDREEGVARPRPPVMPKLGPLRAGEIPGIRADADRPPYATFVIVAASLMGLLVFRAIAPEHVVMTSLTAEPWRYVTAAFSYDLVWYTLVAMVGIGIFGWRLELRHGPLVVLVLFAACGIGANAFSLAIDDTAVLIGAPGAALGMLAAWAVPDLRRLAGKREYEGDLLGTAAIAVTIAAMPLVTHEADAIATFSGGAIGLLLGYLLSFTAAAR